MDDGYEVDQGFDPNDPADAALDPDADGLSNLGELQAGSDPFDPDTDNDTLSDGDEVHVHGTDPTLVDTDGGGQSDAQEIADGTDPLNPFDDVVSLPVTLVDGGGYTWDVNRGGFIHRGLNDAFDVAFVRVINNLATCNGFGFGACEFEATPEDGGRELVMARRQHSLQPGLFFGRKVFVPTDDTFVRYLEIIDNETAAAKEVTVWIRSEVGTGFLSQRVATSTGAEAFNVRDRWIVTDDEDFAGAPAVAFVFAGATTRLLPSRLFTNVPGNDDVEYRITFTVPPGERRTVMHFGVQAVERAVAVARAEEVSRLEGSTLAGLSAAEQAEIVNFFAYADADLDRLADADETALGTDPFDPDTDGDGLRDGFEVDYGFDPLAFDDAGADPDGDGLSSFDEQDALADPTDPDTDDDGLTDGDEVTSGSEASLPDTDADGLLDGEEVHLYGTDPADLDTDDGGLGDGDEVGQGSDPLDGTDDVFTVALPRVLVDGDGYEWDVQQHGGLFAGTEGAFTGSCNPFITPGGFEQYVNGNRVSCNRWTTAAAEDFGRELATSRFRFLGGTNPPVWRSRKVFVPADDSFIRYLEIFDNVLIFEPVTFTVQIRSRVGSGVDTLIAGTASGDPAFTAGDDWIVTDDLDGFDSPAVAHVFHSPNGLVAPSAVSTTAPGANEVTYTYELTVPPSGRVILMHFGVQSFDRATALARADELKRVLGSALDGLSQDERDDVVNFFPYRDADFDRMSDEDEAAVGTDPENPDTDGDGLTDGFEFANGLNPLVFSADEDGDGLENLDEFARGTHPARPDTDGDLLLDGEEVFDYLTDPLAPDSDLGGVEDGREVLFDGTDPLFGGDDRGPVQVNDSEEGVDPALAAAADGNLHVVWSDFRTGCQELFYSMVTASGTALIEDTQLTDDCRDAEKPRIAAGADGRIHVLWSDFEDVRYLRLDPALDDRDGSPGDAAALIVAGPVEVVPVPSSDGGGGEFVVAAKTDYFRNDELRYDVAAGGDGGVHVVWQSEMPLGGGAEALLKGGFFDEYDNEVHYLRLAADGSPAVPDRLVFRAEGSPSGPAGFPDLAVDGRGDAHLVWRGEDQTLGGWGVFYAQLAGGDGAVRIAPTNLTPFRDVEVSFPSLAVNETGDRVTVVFEDAAGSGPEVFLTVLDPTRDDRDGDAADLLQITVLGRTLLTADDGVADERPAVAADALGNLHVSFFETVDVPFDDFFDEVVVKLAVYDSAGQPVLPPLTAGASFFPDGAPPRPDPAVFNVSSAVTWFVDNDFPRAVLLRSFHPDGDGDGLAHRLELELGTDPSSADSDGDGLRDGFEHVHGFDPLTAGEAGGDPDGDGLTNLEEQAAGTDPRAADSDGDGLTDGDEIAVHGTDPVRADTDGDGLGDGDEVDVHGTDPTSADSDGDGIGDGLEVALGLDPLDPTDGDSDFDGDGLTAAQEIALGTDPNDPDSDGDALTDGDEVSVHGTDPLAADSDGDRLSDGEEAVRYGTAPLVADSDADGRGDWEEVVVDGSDPLDDADLAAPVRLTTGLSDQAVPAVDAAGNLHVVWVDGRDDNDEIYYKLLGRDGATLIDDTRLTADAAVSARPSLALDGLGRVHVAWQDERLGGPESPTEVFHTVIDPALDDRDGSAADDAVIAVVDDHLVSAADGVASRDPRLAVDSQDRVHLVWSDEAVGDVRYLRLAADGSVTVAETVIFAGGEFNFRALPALAVDGNDDVHLVLNEQRFTDAAEIFYLMLAGGSGAVLIDATVVTPDDGQRARFPSIGVGPGSEVTVVFQDQRLQEEDREIEIFQLRLDPALDDRDGDAADPAAITVVPDRLLTADDGQRNNHPAAAVDAAGNVFAAYFDSFGGNGGSGDLLFRLVDAAGGVLIPEQRLTEGRTATTAGDYTLALSAADGLTAYVVWTDDRFGSPEVVLRSVNPDVDGDGLSGLEEWLLGTDYRDPDSDGGGRGDGEEVNDGTDPLNGADDLP